MNRTGKAIPVAVLLATTTLFLVVLATGADGSERIEIEKAKSREALEKIVNTMMPHSDEARVHVGTISIASDGGLSMHISGPEPTWVYVQQIRDVIGPDVKISKLTHGSPPVLLGLEEQLNDET